MKFHIETERLILRELRLKDLDGVFELDSFYFEAEDLHLRRYKIENK